MRETLSVPQKTKFEITREPGALSESLAKKGDIFDRTVLLDKGDQPDIEGMRRYDEQFVAQNRIPE